MQEGQESDADRDVDNESMDEITALDGQALSATSSEVSFKEPEGSMNETKKLTPMLLALGTYGPLNRRHGLCDS